jgi:hypothetical protein
MPSKETKSTLGDKIRRSNAVPSTPHPNSAPDKPALSGKPAAVWFDDEDRALLRELSVLLLNHAVDPTHSLIVRTLLRLAPRDETLIDQARKLIALDGRKLRHRKPTRQENDTQVA